MQAFSAPYGSRSGKDDIMDAYGDMAFYSGIKWDMTPVERAWSKALKQVYNVGVSYYDRAPVAKRRQIEKDITEWAKKDDRRGRSAAKVMAAYVAEIIDQGNKPAFVPNKIQMMKEQYARMYGQHMQAQDILKAISGMRADAIIMDETVEYSKNDAKTTGELIREQMRLKEKK